MKPSLKNWLFKNRTSAYSCDRALSVTGRSAIIFMLVLSSFVTAAQNLVPNYSFELYDTCPVAFTDNQVIHAVPWTGPGFSTDLYNSCAPNSWPYHNVPYSSFGFQYAKTGNGYAGITPFPNNGAPDSREYIQTALIDSLRAGSCYAVSFYVNFSNASYCSTNNLAATFTDSSFTNPGSLVVNLPSHIYKFGNPVIRDTVNWVEIKGIYTAAGGEKYITLGNFHDDAHTDTALWNTSAGFAAAYYYVDDVSVIPTDSIPGGMPAFAGNDTTILSSDSAFVGQQLTGLNCNWYEGNTLIASNTSGLFVHPAVTTTYIVEQNLCGTMTYDTVTVHVSNVGIEEPWNGNDFSIYPNPNSGEFSIRSGLQSNYTVQVRDISGRVVYGENPGSTAGTATISLDINSGVYFVYISNSATRAVVVKKLVIRK